MEEEKRCLKNIRKKFKNILKIRKRRQPEKRKEGEKGL